MTEEFKDAMEYIWDRIPKTKEGNVRYLLGDLPYLYQNGFVDSNQFTYEQWKAAFEDCKQDDDSYILTKEKFLSLRKFRYVGPVFEPFDASKVREGEWTDDDLAKLYHRSIKPSSTVPEQVYFNMIKALKEREGLQQNGRLLVNKTVKTQLGYLIDRFPSPRRKLEIEVSRLRKEREKDFREVNENRDVSKFVAGQFESEEELKKFKSLQNKAGAPVKQKIDTSKTVDLKSLKRPPKKISG
ncbi:hypothetical protein K1X76_10160 [bacterium]|nr:hypothetical protein [bacterium]